MWLDISQRQAEPKRGPSWKTTWLLFLLSALTCFAQRNNGEAAAHGEQRNQTRAPQSVSNNRITLNGPTAEPHRVHPHFRVCFLRS